MGITRAGLGVSGKFRHGWSRRAVVVALAGACVVVPVGTATAGASSTFTMSGVPGPQPGTPPGVRVGSAPDLPVGAQPVSALTAGTDLSVDVALAPRDPAALASYARAVSTPGSNRYGDYLRAGQFVDRFGADRSAIAAVDRSLVSAGLHPGPVAADHLSIPVRATAGQLAAAFSIGFTRYRIRGGRIAYANTAAPRLAGTVASHVQAVVGLDDLNLAAPAASGGRPLVSPSGPAACATASSDATRQGSHTDTAVATAYGFGSLYAQGDLGAGQTVALYELQGFGAGDIAAYQSCFHTRTKVTTIAVVGGPLRNSGVGEADVDIEQVVSLAPSAHILVYEGPNNGNGGYATYASIIGADQARVISTSWGLCEPFSGQASATAENTLFEEAAVQGQTVVAASGDEGSEDCLGSAYAHDTLAVDDPASQPFVTGAGGTSWSGSGTARVETAWNDGPTCCWGAGGGGISSFWTMPSYQSSTHGVINAGSSGRPCGAAAGTDCREVPDVSALAGPYPYLEYVSGAWGSWGGTSLAAPLWASLIALSDASKTCSGKDIGFANPLLYHVAQTDPQAFHDVVRGDNDLTGRNKDVFRAGVGYDMATGLGAPNAAVLPAALCALAAA